MLETIIEMIGHIFGELLLHLLVYPGALFRYLIFHPFNKEKKYTDYLEDEYLFWNGVLGFIFVLIVGYLISKFF